MARRHNRKKQRQRHQRRRQHKVVLRRKAVVDLRRSFDQRKRCGFVTLYRKGSTLQAWYKDGKRETWRLTPTRQHVVEAKRNFRSLCESFME
jgi:hypothetical protein